MRTATWISSLDDGPDSISMKTGLAQTAPVFLSSVLYQGVYENGVNSNEAQRHNLNS